MKRATEIYSQEFDAIFFKLPKSVQRRIQEKIDWVGMHLDSFSHDRLQERPEFPLRVGDYRVIYEFDLRTNQIFLNTLGHRRDVYR